MVPNPAQPAQRDGQGGDEQSAALRLRPVSPPMTPAEFIEREGLSPGALGVYSYLRAVSRPVTRPELRRAFRDPDDELPAFVDELLAADLVEECPA